ncbi:diacylglycerol kinase 6-like [Rutidosis leptorrhynchoides]|uniref:diacylglycerol kinase 6-like n=1 Tax=Rutidosis leptorrhynchoides TaxID=125765 RepID=UPI003A9A1BC4
MAMPFKDLEHLNIRFQLIIEATQNFTTIIGKGGYGPVYKGQLSLSGELTTVAVKRLQLNNISCQGLKEFLTEIQLLSRYKHPNLVSLLGFCNQGPEKVLIYEYAHRGSLDKYLRNSRNPTCTLTWKQRLNICIDAGRGLDHLHNHVAKHERVIHRDIKSANVLLDNNLKAMIADFGLSKIGRANEKDSFLITNPCGTHGYCDPSYQRTGILTKESDVYSFGVVLFEVLCGQLCFYMDAEGKQRLLPQQAKGYYKKNKLNQIIDPNLREYMDSYSMNKFSQIAYQCLLDDRERRPSMNLVLQELEKALHLLYPENLKDFWIRDYILLRGSEGEKPLHVPASPVIVFVNSRSGGRLGEELLVSYQTLLNKNQVFDLNEEDPDKVLRQLFLNLEMHKHYGDPFASEIQKRLRIIVAGGDGTAERILGVISDLNLVHPPPVAMMPVGTENNLPFAFGWGKKKPDTDLESVKVFLGNVRDAKEMKVDSWQVLMRVKVPRGDRFCDPMPHSLHAYAPEQEGYHTFRRGFWNYFSMVTDAQVSYGFLTSSRNIRQPSKVSIMKKPGEWYALSIPPNIKSIICLNLPSYSGGLDPWGIPSRRRFPYNNWTPPYVDDGFLEVVGLRNDWHPAVLYAPNEHWTRLAQGRGVRFEFHKGSADHTFIRMDGEQWKQPLPKENDSTVTFEISRFGKVNILASANHPSKSVYASTPPTRWVYDSDEEEEDTSE